MGTGGCGKALGSEMDDEKVYSYFDLTIRTTWDLASRGIEDYAIEKG